jgi:replicative superfamily II helicase
MFVDIVFHSLVNSTLQALEDAGCVRVNEDNTVEPLVMGTVASQYYLSYATVSLFSSNIRADTSLEAKIFYPKSLHCSSKMEESAFCETPVLLHIF